MGSRLRSHIIPRTAPQLEIVQDVVEALVPRQIVVPPSQPPQVLVTSVAVTTIMPSSTTVFYQTTTLPPAQTSATALLNNQPVDAAASVSPTAGSYIGTENPISATSTKVIIVVASVGITAALFVIGFFYWRKRNMKKKADLLDKSMWDRPPSVSVPLGSNWGTYNWDPSSTFAPQTTYKQAVIEMPDPTYVRPGTSGSNRAVPTRAPFAPPNQQTAMNAPSGPVPAYAASPPSMQPRAPSPELPLQRPETRPTSMSQGSTLVPPPPKASRFSKWTNSQLWKMPMPKTPVTDKMPAGATEQSKDGSPDRYSTISAADSVASVARYRTVESWVGVQAGRYEEARIQERIQYQLDEAIGELHRAASQRDDRKSKRMTKMKTIPLQDSSSVYVDGAEDEEGDQVTDLSLIPEAVRKNPSVKRTKSAKHRTNESDMTVFRAHPGTRVDLPNNARIPSAVLDGKFAPNAYRGF